MKKDQQKYMNAVNTGAPGSIPPQQPSNSSVSSRTARPNPDQPMTLAERDDLISQINSLTPQ